MNLGGIQKNERPRARGGAVYPRPRDFSASFRSFDSHPNSQALRPAKRGTHSDSDLNPLVHLSIENEMYRVAQEALCNVRKHSRAGSVAILLNYTSPGVVLEIKDDGQGFEMKPPQPGADGFGLPVMCERANRLGARMDINSTQGTGTEIRMSVPLCGKGSKERVN